MSKYVEFEVTYEDISTVKPVIEWLKEHPAVQGALAGRPGHHVFIEKEISFGQAFGIEDPEDCKGYGDLYFIWPGHREVVDLKFGRIPVSPIQNQQLYLYDVGYISDPEIPYDQKSEVRYTIIQPFVRDPETGSVAKTWVMSHQDRQEMAREMRKALARTFISPPPRTAGDWCKWCSEGDTCGTRLKWVADALTQTKEEPVTNETEILPPKSSVETIVDEVEELSALDPEKMTPAEAARILDLAEIVVPLFQSVQKKWREKAIDEGVEIPGWKLIAGKRTQEWNLPVAEVEHKLAKVWKFKKAQYVKESLITPAQLRKLAGEHLTERQLKNLDEIIRWVDGKPQLVPETNSAPALPGTRVFAPVTEQMELPLPEPDVNIEDLI